MRIKHWKLDRAFTGIQGQIKTLIDRNISQNRPVVGNFKHEEDFRQWVDMLMEEAIELNPIKELTFAQIDIMKHKYLDQVFLYLEQKIEDEERKGVDL